jgi:MinD superfamily P-loop ATPase
MIIAVASGKGGTGKTTVAVNLVSVLSGKQIKTSYIDCDVEEPNGHIFLKPQINNISEASLPFPVIDTEKCTFCGKCAEICQYKAIVFLDKQPLVFQEMCHACGGCFFVCPVGAVSELQRRIGIVEKGFSGDIFFANGKLDIGQAISPPLIREVKKQIPADAVNIVDCPPGTSCPVIESVKGADFVILVTEPTPFGLSDLQLAAEVIIKLKIPFGVFINRSDIGTQDTVQYCERRLIPVMGSIPDDRRIAEKYSTGELLMEHLPEYVEVFDNLFKKISKTLNFKFKDSDNKVI